MNNFKLTIILGLLITLPTIGFSGIANKVDGEFVTISGKVKSVSADSFQLKMNGDMILVEMDDGDWDADGYKLVKGDEVVVNG